MDAARFHNALRILTSIDIDDLRQAGVIDENWGTPEASERNQIGAFIRAPFDEALRMPDANFERLFTLVESRQRAKAPKIRYAPASFQPVERGPLPQALYDLGDVRLVWVNEGDLNALGEDVASRPCTVCSGLGAFPETGLTCEACLGGGEAV